MELTGSNISLLKVSGQWTTYQEYQIDKLRFDECQMLGIITGGASGPSGTYPQCAHLEPSQDNQLSAPPPLPPGAVPIK
jgi:hypothetical protein